MLVRTNVAFRGFKNIMGLFMGLFWEIPVVTRMIWLATCLLMGLLWEIPSILGPPPHFFIVLKLGPVMKHHGLRRLGLLCRAGLGGGVLGAFGKQQVVFIHHTSSYIIHSIIWSIYDVIWCYHNLSYTELHWDICINHNWSSQAAIGFPVVVSAEGVLSSRGSHGEQLVGGTLCRVILVAYVMSKNSGTVEP